MSEQKVQPLIKEISELVQSRENASSPEDDNWDIEVKKELENLVAQIKTEKPDADEAEVVAALGAIKQNIELGEERLGQYLDVTTLIIGIKSELERVKRILELPPLVGLTGSGLLEILKTTLKDKNIERYLQEFTAAQKEKSINVSTFPAGRTYEALLVFTPTTGGDIEKLNANTQALTKILETVPKISERLQSPEFLEFQKKIQKILDEKNIPGQVPVAEIYTDFFITKKKQFSDPTYWEKIDVILTDVGIEAQEVIEWIELDEMSQEQGFDQTKLKHFISELQKAFPGFPNTLFGLIIATGEFMSGEDPFLRFGTFNPEVLKERSKIYKSLQATYGDKFFDPTKEINWMNFFITPPEDFKPFLDPSKPYITVWKEISRFPELTQGMDLLMIMEAEKHREVINVSLLSEADKRFYEYVELFESYEGIEIGNLHNILQIFGYSLSDLNIARHDPVIYELVDYRPFYLDVEDLFKQYPDLKEIMTPNLALKIAKHYKTNQDSFDQVTEFNRLLKGFGMPIDLSFDGITAKTEFLTKLKKAGIPPGSLEWDTSSQGHLELEFFQEPEDEMDRVFMKEILEMREYMTELVDSGEAKKFHDVIQKNWGIKVIEVGDFLTYFEEPSRRKIREILSDPETPQKLKQIATTFGMPELKPESLGDLSLIDHTISDVYKDFENILKHKDKIKAQMPRMEPDGFEDLPDFLRWVTSISLLLTAEGSNYLEILERKPAGDRFGYEFNKASREHFISREENKYLGEVLAEKEFQAAYQQIRRWRNSHKKNPAAGEISSIIEEPSQAMDLKLAYRIYKTPKAIKTVELYLAHFTLDYFNTDLEWVIKVLNGDDTFAQAMQNPEDFKAFIEKSKGLTSLASFQYPEKIYPLAQLFVQIQKHPEREEILFSEKFKSAQKVITDTMKLNPEHWLLDQHTDRLETEIEAFPALLELAASGADLDTLGKWAQRLNTDQQAVYPNDHALFVETLRRGEDLQQYESQKHRNQLISAITKLLPDAPAERITHGTIKKLIEELQWAKADGANKRAQQISEKLNRLRAQYTESPALETLPTLDLTRIQHVAQALKTKAFQEAIGTMVARDIADKTTEHGGILDFVDGQLLPISLPSESHNDGSYAGQLHKEFHGGLTTFHFHALSVDETEYSGPSGYGAEGGSDFGSTRAFNSPGVVLTSLNHPEGNIEKLIINADYYFTLKTGGEEKQIVLDLGTFEVPYSEPEK